MSVLKKIKKSEKKFFTKSRNDSVAAGRDKGGVGYNINKKAIQARCGHITRILKARAAVGRVVRTCYLLCYGF